MIYINDTFGSLLSDHPKPFLQVGQSKVSPLVKSQATLSFHDID